MASVYERTFSVKGKTVLVTGASSGIGRDTALMFAEAGANVIATARRKDRLDELVQNIEKLGQGKAIALQLDVSSEESTIDAVVEEAWKAFGRIDILFNNAGVAKFGASLVEEPAESYDFVFNTNLKGLWLVAKAVTKRQVADGNGGSVINNSSMAAFLALNRASLYSTSKAAVMALTKNMANELGASNIRVNAICPGYMDGPEMSQAIMESKPFLEKYSKGCPIGRPVKTMDLFGAILLLASDAGACITGTSILVDGGYCLTSFPVLG